MPLRTAGLVLFLPFDEGSGLTCNDRSGQGNNGTGAGGISWVTGLWGPYALQFDGGASTVVTVPYSASLAPSAAMTIEAWIKFTSIATWRNVMGKGLLAGPLDYAFLLDANEYPTGLFRNSSGTQVFCGQQSPPPSLNTWYHYAATYDGSGCQFYLNGQPSGSKIALTGTLNDTGGNFTVGQYMGGNGVNAAMDNVAIYNRALSAAEIALDYSFPPMIATLGTQALIIEKATDDFTVVGSDYNVWSSGKAGMKSNRFNIVRTWQLDCVETNTPWLSGTVQYLKTQAASGAKIEFYALQGNTFYADAQVVVDDVTTTIDTTSVSTNLRHYTVKIHESL